jgi:hypothetical protein
MDGSAALPALLQGAADLFRGMALGDAVSGSGGLSFRRVASIERAIRQAGGDPTVLDSHPELDLLRAALLQINVNLALACFLQAQARGEAPGLSAKKSSGLLRRWRPKSIGAGLGMRGRSPRGSARWACAAPRAPPRRRSPCCCRCTPAVGWPCGSARSEL